MKSLEMFTRWLSGNSSNSIYDKKHSRMWFILATTECADWWSVLTRIWNCRTISDVETMNVRKWSHSRAQTPFSFFLSLMLLFSRFSRSASESFLSQVLYFKKLRYMRCRQKWMTNCCLYLAWFYCFFAFMGIRDSFWLSTICKYSDDMHFNIWNSRLIKQIEEKESLMNLFECEWILKP